GGADAACQRPSRRRGVAVTASQLSPPPPPGPGVQAPFVTPPTDGTRQRRWVALGLTALAAAVCCGGGLLGLGGLVVFGSRMVLDKAHATVQDYLTAVQERDYKAAYALLCDDQQHRIDEATFAETQDRGPALESFTVRDAVIGNDVTVPATLRFT